MCGFVGVFMSILLCMLVAETLSEPYEILFWIGKEKTENWYQKQQSWKEEEWK